MITNNIDDHYLQKYGNICSNYKKFQKLSNLKINKQCKSVPLKKELKGILTANYETCGGKLVLRENNLPSV